MSKDAFGYHVAKLPTVNTKMFLEIWDWLEHPKETDPTWYQEDWMRSFTVQGEGNYCGTSCCVAGYTLLEETEMVFDHIARQKMPVPIRSVESPDGVITNPIHDERGPIAEFARMAGHKLGLTIYEANMLFHENNTKERIREVLNAILEHRGEAVRV